MIPILTSGKRVCDLGSVMPYLNLFTLVSQFQLLLLMTALAESMEFHLILFCQNPLLNNAIELQYHSCSTLVDLLQASWALIDDPSTVQSLT